MSELKSKKYKPVYFLHGEESFFIDAIAEYIENNVLNEAEKAFNQYITYAEKRENFDVTSLVETCRRYPMMSPYQVVIVKEAQNIDASSYQPLIDYFKNPLPSTILVICHKEKKLDGRLDWPKKIPQTNISFFLSQPLKEDEEFPKWIAAYLSEHGFIAQQNVVMLIAEHTGNSLSKAANELNKLMILKDDDKEITEDDIEKNLGISKDYNAFELINSLSSLNAARTFFIAEKIQHNKDFKLFTFLPLLNSNFVKALTYKQMNLKTDNDFKKAGVFVAAHKNIVKNFSTEKILQVFDIIREYDLKLKGVGASNPSEYALLKEILFKIMMN